MGEIRAKSLNEPAASSSRPLDLDTLRTVPQASESGRVSDFVASQSRYAKAYAEQGRRELTAWISGFPDRSINTPPQSGTIRPSAFDTPILKPRVPLVSSPHLKPPNEHRQQSEEPASKGGLVRVAAGIFTESTKRSEQRKAPREKPVEAKRREARPSSRPVPGTKRQKTPTSSEIDHAGRLADRRERKRARKAVVNPPKRRTSPSSLTGKEYERDDHAISESNSSQHKRISVGTKKTTKGLKSKKIPAGLALMYGFSSTSVSRNRLTIEPTAGEGVFKKGRASAKTEVPRTSRNKAIKTQVFSEETFLNRISKRQANAHKSAVSEISSEPHSSSAHKPITVKMLSKPITVKGTVPIWPKTPEPSENGDMAAKSVEASTQPVDAFSEAWDIENGRSLPSGTDNPSPKKDASAVVDLRQRPLGRLLSDFAPHYTANLSLRLDSPTDCKCDLPPNDSASARCDSRASSVAPSESISRVLQKARDVVMTAQFSKYFSKPTQESRLALNNSDSQTPARAKLAPSPSISQAGDSLSHLETQRNMPQASIALLSPGHRSLDYSQGQYAHPKPSSHASAPCFSPVSKGGASDFLLNVTAPLARSACNADHAQEHANALDTTSSCGHPASSKSLELALQAAFAPDPSLRYASRRSLKSRRLRYSSLPPSRTMIDYDLHEPPQLAPRSIAEYDDPNDLSPNFLVDPPYSQQTLSYRDRFYVPDDVSTDTEAEVDYVPMDYDGVDIHTDAQHELLAASYPIRPASTRSNAFNPMLPNVLGSDEAAEHASSPSDFANAPGPATQQYAMDLGTGHDDEPQAALTPEADAIPEWLVQREIPRFMPQTSHSVEADVARQLSGHWLPHTF